MYELFDKIIDKNNAYKIEATMHTYIVVSGVPHTPGRNLLYSLNIWNLLLIDEFSMIFMFEKIYIEQHHSVKISLMALEWLQIADKLSMPHLPGYKPKLCIGIHSGNTSFVRGLIDLNWIYIYVNSIWRFDKNQIY